LSGYFAVLATGLTLTSTLALSVLSVALILQFVGKFDLEKEAVSGSLFSITAGQNKISEIFPYEENKTKVLDFPVLKNGIL
jgi:hypothetical protein